MEDLIVLRAYDSKRQTPIKVSPLEDRSGRLFTGQGKHGYYELLTEEEKKSLPFVIKHDTVLTFEAGDVLDLKNNPIDIANWEWVKKHPYIAVDEEKGRASKDAVLYVDNPERAAEVHVSKDKKITMAKAKIYGASSTKKVQLATALGHPGANSLSGNLLEDWLITKAEQTPESITNLLDTKKAKHVEALVIFEDLKRFDLLIKYAGTWRFGGRDGLSIGRESDDVAEYLNEKKNEEQVYIMTEQLKEKKGPE